MGKQTSAQHISRPHTEDTINLALSRLERVRGELDLLADDEDPIAVLRDVKAELFELRALREKIRQQQDDLKPFLARK